MQRAHAKLNSLFLCFCLWSGPHTLILETKSDNNYEDRQITMRQARLQPCRTKIQARLTMHTAFTILYNNKRNEARFDVHDIYIFHFSGCLYTAIRGDNASFQSSYPDSNRFLQIVANFVGTLSRCCGL